METVQIVIVNLITATVMDFFCITESINDSITATFEASSIRGRSSQYQGYEQSGPRASALAVKVHEDYLYGEATRPYTANILHFVNKVKALAYPEYQGYVIPPRCYIKIGDNLAGLCIINNVGVTWNLPIRAGRYINADLQIDFTILEPMSPSASEVERGSSGTGRRENPFAVGGNIVYPPIASGDLNYAPSSPALEHRDSNNNDDGRWNPDRWEHYRRS